MICSKRINKTWQMCWLYPISFIRGVTCICTGRQENGKKSLITILLQKLLQVNVPLWMTSLEPIDWVKERERERGNERNRGTEREKIKRDVILKIEKNLSFPNSSIEIPVCIIVPYETSLKLHMGNLPRTVFLVFAF